MGCDIHSFVMVPNDDGMYEPIVSYVLHDNTGSNQWWRLVQPYDDRNYEMFGLLTNGTCRGGSYEDEGVIVHEGRFNRASVNGATIDSSLRARYKDDDVLPRAYNHVAVSYFDENDRDMHSHGWATLADLKRSKKALKKEIKRLDKQEPLDDEDRADRAELKAILQEMLDCVKRMIINTQAIVYSAWKGYIPDSQVVVCYCFDC